MPESNCSYMVNTKIKIICVIIFLGLCWVFPLEKSIAGNDPKIRTFEFTYITKISNIPKGAEKVSTWLPYPPSNEDQKITPLQIQVPFPIRFFKENNYGNSIIYLSVPNPNRRSIKVKVKFNGIRYEHIQRDSGQASMQAGNDINPGVKKWLQSDQPLPINTHIKERAAQIVKGKTTDLEKARAIYDYVVTDFTYKKSGTGLEGGDVILMCDVKSGNCTDFHSVFIEFCRAVGIPAKFVIGFPLPEERGRHKINGYHCWAEFYLKGYGWIPVDASEANKNPAKKDYYFGSLDENRIQFTTGRNIVLQPPQVGTPLSYFIFPYGEADGKPLTAIRNLLIVKDTTQR
ncbi:MAG: transglutaminase domain-containing protein [wastewater metagenome]|nr:transglutaminase domain-containing protein [Candidatus Loosdrechtia aerotolerans]